MKIDPDDDGELPLVPLPPAPPAVILPERQITPVLTKEQYRDQKMCFATPDLGRNEIEPNIVYKDGKQVKFLLLSKAISAAAWLKALLAAQESYLASSGRRANGQVYGKKLTLGWIKLPYPGYYNMRTAPTLEQPQLVAALYPLLREMDALVEVNIPDYHAYAWRCAMNAIRSDVRDSATGLLVDEDDLTRIADPRGYQVVKNLDSWNMFYTIRGTAFSTIELNRNIVFKSHEDGHNVEGTCVCITTLGSYAGGRLVFPRYGYSAELDNRDLLICDNNHELHGNLGPIVGERYTVVAFLHDSVLGRNLSWTNRAVAGQMSEEVW